MGRAERESGGEGAPAGACRHRDRRHRIKSAFKDSKIENAVDAIGGELNSQYMLSYRPVGAENPGYHTIKVTVDRPGVKVRTRPGYYLEAK